MRGEAFLNDSLPAVFVTASTWNSARSRHPVCITHFDTLTRRFASIASSDEYQVANYRKYAA